MIKTFDQYTEYGHTQISGLLYKQLEYGKSLFLCGSGAFICEVYGNTIHLEDEPIPAEELESLLDGHTMAELLDYYYCINFDAFPSETLYFETLEEAEAEAKKHHIAKVGHY